MVSGPVTDFLKWHKNSKCTAFLWLRLCSSNSFTMAVKECLAILQVPLGTNTHILVDKSTGIWPIPTMKSIESKWDPKGLNCSRVGAICKMFFTAFLMLTSQHGSTCWKLPKNVLLTLMSLCSSLSLVMAM